MVHEQPSVLCACIKIPRGRLYSAHASSFLLVRTPAPWSALLDRSTRSNFACRELVPITINRKQSAVPTCLDTSSFAHGKFETADGYFREPRLCRVHHDEPGVRRSVCLAGQPGGVISSRCHDGSGLHADRRDHAFQFRLLGEQEVRAEDGCDFPALLRTAFRTGKFFFPCGRVHCLANLFLTDPLRPLWPLTNQSPNCVGMSSAILDFKIRGRMKCGPGCGYSFRTVQRERDDSTTNTRFSTGSTTARKSRKRLEKKQSQSTISKLFYYVYSTIWSCSFRYIQVSFFSQGQLLGNLVMGLLIVVVEKPSSKRRPRKLQLHPHRSMRLWRNRKGRVLFFGWVHCSSIGIAIRVLAFLLDASSPKWRRNSNVLLCLSGISSQTEHNTTHHKRLTCSPIDSPPRTNVGIYNRADSEYYARATRMV